MLEANPAGGAYKRWPGVEYHPEDIKGKGEPSYTVEKQLKEHNLNENGGYEKRRSASGAGEQGIEMQTHRRGVSSGSAGGGSALASTGVFDESREGMPRRSGSLSQGLKKRWGSVKKHMHRDSE